jgi:hypothetical protein
MMKGTDSPASLTLMVIKRRLALIGHLRLTIVAPARLGGAPGKNAIIAVAQLGADRRGRDHHMRTITAGATGMIRSVHRIATTWMALSVTAVLVPGCGGSGRASSSNASTPVTKAQALAYADAVNLREADLGWERVRLGGKVKVSRADVVFARCYGGVDPHRWVVLTYSTRYGKTGEASADSMQSEVLVMPTAALAVEDAGAMLSARGFGCFAREQARATIRTASGRIIHRRRGTGS